MLITATCSAGLLLAALLARRAVAEWINPLVAMPLAWGTVLLLIAIAQPAGYFQIDVEAAVLYLIGTMAFIGGGLAVEHRFCRRRSWSDASIDRIDYRGLAYAALALHAILLPMWWSEVTAIAGNSSDLLIIAFQLRVKAVTNEATTGALVGNYLILGFILVPVLALGAMRGRLPAWLALIVALPWLATNLLTNGRAGLVQLVLAVAYLRFREPARLRPLSIVIAVAMFFVLFGTGAVLLGKGDVGKDLDVGALTLAVLENLGSYLLQGPILFSRYVSGELALNPTWDALSFGCEVLSRLRMCEIPPLHQEFADFASDGREGNVYSVYFSTLPRYGVAGTLALLAVYGAWATFHHRRAAQGDRLTDRLLAAYLFSAIPLSVFSDLFAPNLNFLIKTAVVSLLLQSLANGRQSSMSSAFSGEAART